MRFRRSGRRADGDFLKLWAGQTVSMFGAQITAVALPLTAALHLDATPAQMGVLVAAGSAPYLVLGLVAGVWIDRTRRRPVLIAADLGRAALLIAIPLLALAGLLRMELLIVIALGLGTGGMLFELAHPSYLPSLVGPDRLAASNARLRTSLSVAELGGPGAAGVLVGLVTAPIALIVDALTFLASAAGLHAIRRPEPAPDRAVRRDLRREAAEGLRVTFRDPLLRAGACAAATYNLFWSAIEAVLVLYVVRRLGMAAEVYALTFAVGAAGALLGSLASAPLARWLGVGRAIVASAAVSCTALLLLALIDDPGTGAVLLAAAFFLRGLGLTGWNIQIVSLQQTLVAGRLLGRMNAAYLLLSFGAGAVGALAGGTLGGVVGLRPTVIAAAAGLSLAWLWLALSPLPRVRSLADLRGPAR
jgi:MFS family permease